MFTKASVLFLHALTSMHPGSGSELGLVDLPVQREKHTGYPKIDGSSLKGAIRAAVEANSRLRSGHNRQEMIDRIFGKAESDDTHAGAVSFSDARVLLFPVRSLKGVFAWVTCPHVLKRFEHELAAYGTTYELEYFSFPLPDAGTISSERLAIKAQEQGYKVVLAEYTFEVMISPECQQLAGFLGSTVFPYLGSEFIDRLVVLDDDAFVDFVSMFTEVNARIKINAETGTVDPDAGALWYEENIPPETVFYSFCFAGNERTTKREDCWSAEQVMDYMKAQDNLPEVFQLGGNSTIGRGMVRRIWL